MGRWEQGVVPALRAARLPATGCGELSGAGAPSSAPAHDTQAHGSGGAACLPANQLPQARPPVQVASVIDKWGSPHLRGEYLPALTAMEARASYCLTEPGRWAGRGLPRLAERAGSPWLATACLASAACRAPPRLWMPLPPQ